MIKPISIQTYLKSYQQGNSVNSEEEREIAEVIYIWYTEGFSILQNLKSIEISNKEKYLEVQENLVKKYDFTILSLLANKVYQNAFKNILSMLIEDEVKSHLSKLLLLSYSSKNQLQ
ncbi:hypothetical protein [Vibrio comitans]|uniref:Uncharacterized protein n=1 Tax=Vibrio comitans NBRC 102076 TaxID=1219078 RepID=A0A4Y3IR30_9VIBR|nr:hypothetical protein [Vibrio comitans]GEA61943.1 hypothetical protein VCO01S_31360 [Vibrio comitans NBRC 102076]